jgi:hypothetical protein
MKRIIIISIIFCAAWINIKAQSANDAMLFSQHYAGGTARSIGMSGAFGALGGDLSVMSANPAGLAIYRSSEFTFTPGLNFTSANAKYADNTFNEKNTRFIINNVGYVYTRNFYQEKGLQSLSFGIGYNRLSNFNSSAYIKRSKATSSMLDEFLYYANGVDNKNEVRDVSQFDSFYEGLAYDTKAIYKDPDPQYAGFISDYDLNTYEQSLSRTMSTGGGIGEYDVSLGLNFNHQLFIGATLGIQDVYYKEYYFHVEEPGFKNGLDYFNFSDEFSSNGWGLNLKAGIIYRPIQALRLGAAIHTPTYLWMRPYHLTGMETWFNNGDEPIFRERESDPSGKYRIRTPWRYNLSAASVIGNIGMVDVDVEIVDYANNSILPKSDYDVENKDVSAILKTSVNVKGGIEFRLGPVYLRGGAAYYGNPYNKDAFNADIKKTLKETISYSGGIGFRSRNFYMDAAYSFTKHPERINNLYISYNKTEEWYEQAKLQTNSNKIVLTFGFKF